MPWSEDRRRLGMNSSKYTKMCREIVQSDPWCRRCGLPIDLELTELARDKDSVFYHHPMAGTAGHIIAVVDAPHLATVRSNHQPEHRRCNSRDGQKIATRRVKSKRRVGVTKREW